MAEKTLTFHSYIDGQRRNLDNALKFRLFGIACPKLHDLYALAIGSLAEAPNSASPAFGQLLLICHSCYLSAATLVGQAQPDDAGAITRRAIEAVRLAAAMKADPMILDKWMAYEDRLERWKARREGKKPKPLNIHIPVEHPIVKELMDIWGMLSDSEVHFTPEYFSSLPWKIERGALFLNYFPGDQQALERSVVHLVGTHLSILRVLEECLDGDFRSIPLWDGVVRSIHEVTKPYADKLGGASDAEVTFD